jgi:hypothetical protein
MKFPQIFLLVYANPTNFSSQKGKRKLRNRFFLFLKIFQRKFLRKTHLFGTVWDFVLQSAPMIYRALVQLIPAGYFRMEIEQLINYFLFYLDQ